MIYLYDNAIVDDLSKSFNEDLAHPVVRVIGPEQILGVAAQLQEDAISFPLVALDRNDVQIDETLTNFTKSIKGVPAVFDKVKNNIYNEKSYPISLSYVLSVMTTNQTDMDEILREIIFKYGSMYFLKIKIPYESRRDISFGITLDKGYGIQKQSGISQYTESGQLYQSSIQLNCEGCVLIHYTPVHLKRNVIEIETL